MKKGLVLLLCVAMGIGMIGCGSSSESHRAESKSYDAAAAAEYAYDEFSYSNYVGDEMITMEAEAPADANGSSSVTTTENATTSNRKLIKKVDLTLETKEFDTLLTNVDAKIKELGGYVESMNTDNGSIYSNYRASRNANITVRIPASKLDTFVNAVGEKANVRYKSESVEDVTLTYVDMDSHKRMLEEEQGRLLQFLDEATTIEEIITIEDRLTEVKYQLESMESQLRTYDNLVDYSTVYIAIEEVVDYTETPDPELTPVERMTEGFKESMVTIGVGLREFGIWFVIKLPFIILLAIVAVVLIVIGRVVTKKNAEKLEKLREERARKQAQMKADANKSREERIDEGVFVARPDEKKD